MKKKLIVCLLLLSSCVSNPNRVQQEDVLISELPYTVSLEKEIDHIQRTGLSEIGSSITYIPLETTKWSLLGELRKIIFTGSYIFVSDKDRMLMFDSSGKFLKQIGRRGQGPGEYRNIMDYCLAFDGRKIYLLTTLQECFEFDVEGKFLHSYKIDSVPDRMLPLKEGLFVFHCLNGPVYIYPVRQSLIISDLNNNIKKTFPNYHKRVNQPGVSVSGVPFYYHQNELRFKEFGVDTLYTITEDELKPHAIFQLGKKEIPADLHTVNLDIVNALRPYQGCFWFRWLLEDLDNFYITLEDDRNKLYAYYNKSGKQVKVIGDQGFQNNIDGGLPFFPKYVYNDSILVGYVNTYDLHEHLLKSNTTEMRNLYGQKYDDLLKLTKSLDEEANQVVVLVSK